MSLLYPLALLGLVAVAAPIWLHMRLHADKILPFSALRFLDNVPAPRAQGFRFRDLLLLVARVGALMLVVLAFSWPYVKDDYAERIRLSRVHILDATLSQGVDNGFDEDRKRVLQSLADSEPDVENAVIVLSAKPQVVVEFGVPYLEAEQRLRALEPTYQRGTYLDAVRLAQSALERSLGEKSIVLHGDHQENQWTEHESSPAFLEGIHFEIAEPPTELRRSNVSVSRPLTRRHVLGEEQLVELTTTLRWQRQDASAESLDPVEAVVRIEANGEEVMARSMKLDGPSGQTILSATWPVDGHRLGSLSSLTSDWMRGSLRVETDDDALDSDNQVFFFLPPLTTGRLALLARSRFLRAALSPETMEGRWEIRPLDLSSDVLNSPDRDGLDDVLVIEGSFLHSQQGRALVHHYLESERGVCLFLERMTPPIRRFVRELGLRPAPPGKRRGSGGLSKKDASDEAFRFVAADHAIFAPFVRGELGKLLDVRIREHQVLTAEGAVALAYGESGDGLIFEGRGTKGRLLVFSFAFERSQTNWPLEPSFVPFLDVALHYLRGSETNEQTFFPGDFYEHTRPRASLDGTETSEPLQVILRAADMSDRDAIELARADFDEAGNARLTLPDVPGLYALSYDDDKTFRAMVNVNPPPLESELRYLTEPPALSSWVVPEETIAKMADADPYPLALELSSYALEQRYWYWLLWAAVIALVAESVFAAYTFPRGQTGQTGQTGQRGQRGRGAENRGARS